MIESLAPALNQVWIKAIAGSLMGVFAYFFDVALYSAMFALFVLALMDLFTAFLARGENPTEPFSRPFRRTAHKIAGYFVSISSVYILAKVVNQDFGVDLMMLDNMLIWFFIVHEVISIIENVNKAGIPVPYLEKLQKVKQIIETK